MLPTSAWLALVTGFWSLLYLLDAYAKTHKRYGLRYCEFQDRNGIQVTVAQVRWYSTCLNRVFLKVGQWKPALTRVWFTAGVWFGIAAMLSSIALLIWTLIKSFSVEKKERVLTPVMPGVNLPLNQIVYYFAVLFISGVFHEFGHAMAAVREQVRVNGFGIFLLAIYPGAFVDLHTDQLNAVSPIRQLRIYCAGIWHNFVLVLAGIFVMLTLPALLSPLYVTGSGVVLTDVIKNSPVFGKHGLQSGDFVNALNGCPVNSIEDWSRCMGAIVYYPPPGYCMPVGKLQQMSHTVPLYVGYGGHLECCNNTSASDLCFSYEIVSDSENQEKSHSCVEARPVTEQPRCQKNSDCLAARRTVCIHPFLDKNTKLIKIMKSRGKSVLYVGDPYLFGHSVSVSNYIPKYSYLPISLPDIIDLFCRYLISLSGALAILNAVPCFALDGQYILTAFIEFSLKTVLPNREDRESVQSLTLIFGTILLAANILLALYTLFVS
ncbi:membrane-bound transcription factor site-2 protease-like isoform X2 [Anneissia japonica]|uniref:membrane-bound transcription factor site-2 protease-like isoform X2 n=1 Tax=Anneissia japonica TaxID=1529436 RepID=UPI001425ADD8|nr:membrane-bound transcription factor site-2 protease-like isoform X2 [Anneissia japonica]